MTQDKKSIIISIIISLVIVGSTVLYANNTSSVPGDAQQAVQQADGVQVVEITARGGYSPKVITARAGVATRIDIVTKGTYDCSASLVIPKLNYQKFLAPDGVEQITIPAEKANGTIHGLCSMGMYSFKIVFN